MAKLSYRVYQVLPSDCEHINSPIIVEGLKTKDYTENTESKSLSYFHLDERPDSSYYYYTSFKDACDFLSPLIVSRGGLYKKPASVNIFVLLLYDCISFIILIIACLTNLPAT